MMELASIESEDRGSWFLLRILGEIDISNVRQLAEVIEATIPNAAPRIVVDLSETAYLDSAGLKLLVQLADRLRTRRRELRLVVPKRAPIRAVLELIGLPRLIPLEEQVEEEPIHPDG